MVGATWLGSTLGASAEDRLSGDSNRLRLVKWATDNFAELVAEKLKGFEREGGEGKEEQARESRTRLRARALRAR